jgi:glutamine amidotransferase
MIAIIDYGMGNIHSVRKALENAGARVSVTGEPSELRKADKIVLPGVGAFGDAMYALSRGGLADEIRHLIKDGRIFLGICLGMHLLFDSSEESVGVPGLGVIPGVVVRFPAWPGLKVPHMGWNQFKLRSRTVLCSGDAGWASVYFCHSYFPVAKDTAVVAASTEYGQDFASILWYNNVFAMQFHPRKARPMDCGGSRIS